MKKMKGYAMLGIGKTGWIEKKRPECGPLDAIVAPIAVAPCTSDVHTVWEGALGERSDMILGHEGVGEVVEWVPREGLQAGRQGHPSGHHPGLGSRWSPRRVLHTPPAGCSGWKFRTSRTASSASSSMSMRPTPTWRFSPTAWIHRTLSCGDMVPTGFHGVELADVQFGDSVCVIGIGPVGLTLRRRSRPSRRGAPLRRGPAPNCIQVAKEYGATDIVNYREGDIVEQVMKKTGGRSGSNRRRRRRCGTPSYRPSPCSGPAAL